MVVSAAVCVVDVRRACEVYGAMWQVCVCVCVCVSVCVCVCAVCVCCVCCVPAHACTVPLASVPACLALAELSRRGLLLPHRLDQGAHKTKLLHVRCNCSKFDHRYRWGAVFIPELIFLRICSTTHLESLHSSPPNHLTLHLSTTSHYTSQPPHTTPHNHLTLHHTTTSHYTTQPPHTTPHNHLTLHLSTTTHYTTQPPHTTPHNHLTLHHATTSHYTT